MMNWEKNMWKKDCSHFPHIWAEKISARWILEKIREHLECHYKAIPQMRYFQGAHCAGEHFLTAYAWSDYTSDKSHSWERVLSLLRFCHLTRSIRETALHGRVLLLPISCSICQVTTSDSLLGWQHNFEGHRAQALLGKPQLKTGAVQTARQGFAKKQPDRSYFIFSSTTLNEGY